MSHKRIKHTDQEWFELIQDCMASGLQVKSWCGQHNITTKAFYYHARQLRQKGYAVPQKDSSHAAQGKQEIVCLNITDGENILSAEAALHIRLRGIHIEVSNHAGEDLLRNTFRALEELC